jgi:SET domain-containing protein
MANSNGPVEVTTTKVRGRGVFAQRRIGEGEAILRFSGRLVSRWEVKNPNAALQLDEDLFLESDGAIDECLNHSCSPNCSIDFDRLMLVACRDIDQGEELTFNYNTSEYDLEDQRCAFICLCGSDKCIGHVKGFGYLASSRKEEIAPNVSPFLKRKWKEEKEPQ